MFQCIMYYFSRMYVYDLNKTLGQKNKFPNLKKYSYRHLLIIY